MSIRKAVIPAAGLGTRFLPATKAVPKELLTIVDRPSIQYVVEEAVAAGIEEVIFVTGIGKHLVMDHFDRDPGLTAQLRERGRRDLVAELQRIEGLARISSVRQGKPLGLGHAVLCARELVGDEPFAVLLPDDIMDGATPAIGQLTAAHERTGTGVISIMDVEADQVHLYGVIDGTSVGNELFRVKSLVEKPPRHSAPSTLAVTGRYVLPPEVFDYLADTPPGHGGEIQLTDALNALARHEGLHALRVEGQRFDSGEKVGWMVANLHFGLKDPDLRDRLLSQVRPLVCGHDNE